MSIWKIYIYSVYIITLIYIYIYIHMYIYFKIIKLETWILKSCYISLVTPWATALAIAAAAGPDAYLGAGALQGSSSEGRVQLPAHGVAMGLQPKTLHNIAVSFSCFYASSSLATKIDRSHTHVFRLSPEVCCELAGSQLTNFPMRGKSTHEQNQDCLDPISNQEWNSFPKCKKMEQYFSSYWDTKTSVKSTPQNMAKASRRWEHSTPAGSHCAWDTRHAAGAFGGYHVQLLY